MFCEATVDGEVARLEKAGNTRSTMRTATAAAIVGTVVAIEVTWVGLFGYAAYLFFFF
jgi:hypothetical protein